MPPIEDVLWFLNKELETADGEYRDDLLKEIARLEAIKRKRI